MTIYLDTMINENNVKKDESWILMECKCVRVNTPPLTSMNL